MKLKKSRNEPHTYALFPLFLVSWVYPFSTSMKLRKEKY